MIGLLHFRMSELDKWEQHYIKMYADNGYQLRNKTSGSQGAGKAKIDEYRPSKGYRDGIEQGRKILQESFLPSQISISLFRLSQRS